MAAESTRGFGSSTSGAGSAGFVSFGATDAGGVRTARLPAGAGIGDCTTVGAAGSGSTAAARRVGLLADVVSIRRVGATTDSLAATVASAVSGFTCGVTPTLSAATRATGRAGASAFGLVRTQPA